MLRSVTLERRLCVPTLEHRDEWEWGPRYSALLTQPRARWTASCHFA